MTTSGGDLHPDFNPERWVTATGYEGRLLLGYNPHVHSGRIGVWSESLGTGTRISASDVIDASPEARAWIDGFLTGNEPHPKVMFGDEVYDLPDDDPKWMRWRAAVGRFRRTRRWEGGYWMDLTPIDATAEAVEPVWIRRGDEIWVWDGSRWNAADPQPAWAAGDPPGTPCSERAAHSMVEIDDRHTQCEDCGRVSEARSV